MMPNATIDTPAVMTETIILFPDFCQKLLLFCPLTWAEVLLLFFIIFEIIKPASEWRRLIVSWIKMIIFAIAMRMAIAM